MTIIRFLTGTIANAAQQIHRKLRQNGDSNIKSRRPTLRACTKTGIRKPAKGHLETDRSFVPPKYTICSIYVLFVECCQLAMQARLIHFPPRSFCKRPAARYTAFAVPPLLRCAMLVPAACRVLELCLAVEDHVAKAEHVPAADVVMSVPDIRARAVPCVGCEQEWLTAEQAQARQMPIEAKGSPEGWFGNSPARRSSTRSHRPRHAHSDENRRSWTSWRQMLPFEYSKRPA